MFTLCQQVRKTVLEVEYPLIEGQLAEIDQGLEQAEKSLNWENEGETIPTLVCHVKSLIFARLLSVKEKPVFMFGKCHYVALPIQE